MFQTSSLDSFNFGFQKQFVSTIHMNGLIATTASAYLHHQARNGFEKSTIQSYASDLKKFYDFLLTNIDHKVLAEPEDIKDAILKIQDKLLEADRALMEGFVEYLSNECNNTPSTVSHALTVLQGFYNFLSDVGFTQHSLVTEQTCKGLVKHAKTQWGITTNVREQYIYPEYFKKVLLNQAWTKSDFMQRRNELALKLRYEAGFRSFELIAHGNFEVSKIRNLLSATGSSSALNLDVIGKGNKLRTTLLNPELVTALKNFINRDLKGYKNGCIFTTVGKNKRALKSYDFHDEAFTNAIKHYLKNKPNLSQKQRKDWEQKTPYGLRHCFATNACIEMMLNNKPYQILLKDLMGHESFRTTLNYIQFAALKILSDPAKHKADSAKVDHIHSVLDNANKAIKSQQTKNNKDDA